MCNFHVDYLQGNHRYDMILGRDIFSELPIDLCFSNNIIRGNGVPYTGCLSPMKDVTNINFNALSVGLHDEKFWNE